MQVKPVGTQEFYVLVGKKVERVHLAVPTRGIGESNGSLNRRLDEFRQHWADQNIVILENEETPAGNAARQALATVRHFLKPERRHLPILQTFAKKINKYPPKR